MFERFKKNRPADAAADTAAGTGRTAVAERPADERPADERVPEERPADERVPDERPAATSVNERLDDDRTAGDDRTAVRETPEQRASLADRRDDDHDDHDHSTRNAAVAGGAGVAAGEVAGRHHERKREREIASEETATGVQPGTRREPVGARDGSGAAVLGDEGLATMRRRQRAEFGGISWGAAFFGWLSAVGLASILTSILVAAGAAIGIQQVKNAANGDTNTIGLAGAILLLVVLAIAWYAGGYVAGRMARFDGVRQGFAVWIWTILFIVLAAVAAIIGGTQYDVANQLNLPSIPTNNSTVTTGGAIAAGAALLVTLLFAILGGKAGDLFHRKVDRVATDRYEDEPVA